MGFHRPIKSLASGQHKLDLGLPRVSCELPHTGKHLSSLKSKLTLRLAFTPPGNTRQSMERTTSPQLWGSPVEGPKSDEGVAHKHGRSWLHRARIWTNIAAPPAPLDAAEPGFEVPSRPARPRPARDLIIRLRRIKLCRWRRCYSESGLCESDSSRIGGDASFELCTIFRISCLRGAM